MEDFMIPKEKEELIKHYNKGLGLYKQRKWDEAILSFKEALSIFPDDGPSDLYLKRCIKFKENPPPEDWDGVFIMTTK